VTGTLRIRLFGRPSVEYAGRPIRIAVRPMCVALLAMLITDGAVPRSRKALAAELWPDDDASAGKANLRRHLSALVTALPPRTAPWIATDDSTLTWAGGDDVWCDVVAFRAALREPGAGPSAGELYAGDFLADSDHEWVVAQREQLRALAVDHLMTRSVELHDVEDDHGALEAAQRVLEIDPLNEKALGLVLEIEAGLGNHVAASRAFADFETRLRRELDAAPSPETLESIARIRSGGARPRSNVPVPLTSYFAAAHAVEDVAALVRAHRLVTIIGTGGSGKTRLALEAAPLVAPGYRDGAWFVDLAAFEDPAALDEAIARALDVPRELSAKGFDGLAAWLRNRRALVVLDNCEHLVDAVAAIVFRLLQAAPRITVLATSREALAVHGEAIYRLEPLPADVAAALFVDRARTAGRAAAVAADVHVALEQLCAALDGLPLAIEIAASLLGTLSLDDLVRSLGDRLIVLRSRDRAVPSRHKTLLDVIEWSFALLSSDEAKLLVELGAFHGTFDLAAIEGVCDASIATLVGLVEKSMVQRSDRHDDRWRLLFSIAEFAREHLHARADAGAATRERHARHYAHVVQTSEEPSFLRDEAAWLRRIAIDFENIRSAVTWLLYDGGDPATGVRTVIALQRFFMYGGRNRESVDWIARARLHVDPGSDEEAALLHATALVAIRRRDYPAAFEAITAALTVMRRIGAESRLPPFLATMCGALLFLGRLDEAERHLEEGLMLAERTGDVRSDVSMLVGTGYLSSARGKPEAAAAYYRQALEGAEALREPRLLAVALNRVAASEFVAERYEAAESLLQRAIDIGRTFGDDDAETAGRLNDLGDIAIIRGDVGRAWLNYDEALGLATANQSPNAIAQALRGVAIVAAMRNQPRRAAQLLGASQRAHVGWERVGVNRLMWERASSLIAKALAPEDFERTCEAGAALETALAIENARTLWESDLV
jgi:predicted ATPase/DNA-binding SARP family transcriptional activator